MNNDLKKIKAVISFSGGKDCILSLYRALKDNYHVCSLLVTVDEKENSCFHEIPYNILSSISESLNIPLISINCGSGLNYEEQFENILRKEVQKGAEVCIFGDIDIEEHRKWGEERCRNAKLNSFFPLWQENREKLTNEVIESGFKAVIKKVNLNYLDESFLGKVLDKELVKKIKQCGSDPCGENGEYHTIVIDGPIFSKSVQIKNLGNKICDNYGYLQIE